MWYVEHLLSFVANLKGDQKKFNSMVNWQFKTIGKKTKVHSIYLR